MPTVTLLAKAYDSPQVRQVEKNLKSTFEGLRVESKALGVTSRGWIQISVSGEDENAALHYLRDNIGLCPTDLESVERFSTLKGCITALNENKTELHIDVGVFSPSVVDAAIPLQRLQAQLGDGRKVPLKKLNELFGFCENLPLTAKVLSVSKEKSHMEAELAERQQRLYRNWTESLLDRLLILGAHYDRIELALNRAGFGRDVVDVEPLGMFEFAVVCKLGTDAAGLIPRIGKGLREATFSVFSPRRILGFLEDRATLPIF